MALARIDMTDLCLERFYESSTHFLDRCSQAVSGVRVFYCFTNVQAETLAVFPQPFGFVPDYFPVKIHISAIPLSLTMVANY